MNITSFNEEKLPIKDLETIGVASDGKLLLDVDDLKALLSGRRTGMLELQNLEGENIKIKSINGKISLRPNERGEVDLLIHPVYRKPQRPDFVDEFEAEELIAGDIENLLKITVDSKGNRKELLVEYDAETREFIVSDTEKILAPDMVNNEFLTPAQKEAYRKGKEVKIADGTRFNYSGTDKIGIRADRLILVASVLIDGGLSYMVYRGLNALFNKPRDPQIAEKQSPGLLNALKDMENQRNRVPHQEHRAYTRGGSR